MKKTFYEFFAGGGMAHAGLGSDWACAFANDFDSMKGEAYAANWGGKTLVVQDIATVQPSQLPGRADLAWASFPCQDLSLAGNGAGLNGERSGTFWPFMSLMGRLRTEGRKPSVVALENVCGAITSHGGKDFEAMIEALCDLDYRVGAMVIDAVHFVPQSRPRLFVVAVDEAADLPQECVGSGPSPAWHPESVIRAHNRLRKPIKERWIWWSMSMPKRRLKTLDDLVERDPIGVNWHSREETEKLLHMMTPVNRQKVVQAQDSGRLKVGTIYRRTRNGVQRAEVRFDGIAGCLRTPSGGSSRQTIMVVDGPVIRSRLLSPREAARLMGLRDTYSLPPRYNDAYHLAGDGVAVPVVSHLAKNIITPVVNAIGAVTVASLKIGT
jgi:DNA (cytosine-5)-methyltransferase 1